MSTEQIYYSPSARGFFGARTHADKLAPDCVPVTPEHHQALLAAEAQGRVIVPDASGAPVLADKPLPGPAEQRQVLSNAVQAHLNTVAKAWGYDNIGTAVSYADEPAVPQFQAEGRALRGWRSQVWTVVAEQLAADTLPAAAELMQALPAAPVKP